MRTSSERRRFVHLGERLDMLARIRAGRITEAEAAAELGVHEAEVAQWVELHGNDRLVTIDELRVPDSPGARLEARARRLAGLLAIAERRVRELHLQLISKEFGEKPHPEFDLVARAQPRGR